MGSRRPPTSGGGRRERSRRSLRGRAFDLLPLRGREPFRYPRPGGGEGPGGAERASRNMRSCIGRSRAARSNALKNAPCIGVTAPVGVTAAGPVVVRDPGTSGLPHPLGRTQLLQCEPQDVAGLGSPPSEASDLKERAAGRRGAPAVRGESPRRTGLGGSYCARPLGARPRRQLGPPRDRDRSESLPRPDSSAVWRRPSWEGR